MNRANQIAIIGNALAFIHSPICYYIFNNMIKHFKTLINHRIRKASYQLSI